MFVIRLIGKIAALPLIVLTAIAGFLFNLATDLSGYVIGPALLLILGFDIYFLITTQWIHVAILTMFGAVCFAILFGQAVVIVALEGARDGLIRELAGMKVQLQPEEKKLAKLTDRVINKLKGMDDEAFQQLDLYPD